MRNGLTLIEWLVIVAIVAILAAIFYPIFQLAWQETRQAAHHASTSTGSPRL